MKLFGPLLARDFLVQSQMAYEKRVRTIAIYIKIYVASDIFITRYEDKRMRALLIVLRYNDD
ncbi:hypothetical protein KSX_15160 [Ktedonospora formicarum]|uniref:Uncharacterized protein n=1 Tax=Ktedonospora formicarum TaxID=2778364 RepID=A0A8J3HZH1_9CHLR|nr:hypothetical protein KSX_15160 [Ktedonospora formicarum]